MTVKEFAAGSAKALLTTTKVLFRILVGLTAALWSMVLFIWSHGGTTEYPVDRTGDGGLIDMEREELARLDGSNTW